MADDEYEYEYSTSETSTFLVELDLTTLNGIKRDSTARRRTRPKRPRKNKRRQQEDGEADDQSSHAEEDEAEVGDEDPDAVRDDRKRDTEVSFQVLDLGTANPIVAYKGDFYSCAWHDVIGTEMFFALPHEELNHTPLKSSKEYQLLGTSRIKLVGRKAKVLSKAQARKKQQTRVAAADGEQQQNEASTPDSDYNAAVREQGDFLQKLMEIQQARRAQSSVEQVDEPD